MTILGIETSCDETAAAIVQDGTRILSNVVASSIQLHAKTGGIIPEIAAREQIKCILPVIKQALKDTKIQRYKDTKKKNKNSPNILVSQYPNIDAIAVTIGPGLIGSLLVGVETARTLSWLWNKPIVPVNHLKAHLYANFLNQQLNKRTIEQSVFPAIGLIVSGGHTDLVLIKNHGDLKWLGGTRDDAAGECFDKCARLLGLGYPGGPAIETCASKFNNRTIEQLNNEAIKLPRPMINQDNFDFSFSGLKTAVLNHVKHFKLMEQWNNRTREQLAFQLQEAITDVLVTKTLNATQKFKVKSILLGGGVAANSLLRKKLNVKCQMSNVKCFVPSAQLCTDNAAVIASYAYFNYKPVPWKKIKPNPGLVISSP